MSLRDQLKARLSQPTVADISAPGADLRSRLKADPRLQFPPPPTGAIHQSQVMPEATGREDTLLGQGKEVLKAYYKNLGGAAVAPVQALRHPIATAVGVPASTVGGFMDLAEMALPGVGDQDLPGHKSVQKVIDWSKEKIKSDAPFKEAGQYAAAVPDLISIVAPFAGATKIPGVEKALAGTTKSLGKGVNFIGKTVIPERLASRGRELFAAVKGPKKLELAELYFSLPQQARRARVYIDDPNKAPTQYLREIAERMQVARHNDTWGGNWENLSLNAKRSLAILGRFKGSKYHNLRVKANEIGTLRGKAAEAVGLKGKPQVSPFTTEAPSGGTPKTKAQMRAQQINEGLRDAPTHLESVLDDFMSSFVTNPIRKLRDYAFSRPGTKHALAAQYADQPVRRFLKSAVPRWVELGDSKHKEFSAETDSWLIDLVNQIRKDAGGDFAKIDKLARHTYRYLKTGERKAVGSADEFAATAQRVASTAGIRSKPPVQAAEPSMFDDGAPMPEPPPDMDIPVPEAPAPLTPEELAAFAEAKAKPPSRANEGFGVQIARDILAKAEATGDPKGIRIAQQILRKSQAWEARQASQQHARLRLVHGGKGPPRRTANGGISMPRNMIKNKSRIEVDDLYAEADKTLPILDSGPDLDMSDDLIKLVDDIRGKMRSRLEKSGAEGFLTLKEIQKLSDPNELMLDVYRAAHDPKWIDHAKSLDSWKSIRNTFKKANPTWTDAEINGSIRQLLKVEVAQRFESEGLDAIAGMEKIKDNPILKHIFSDDEYKELLSLDISHLYGKINDAPTAIELSSEVLARNRARVAMSQGLSDEMHKVGLAVHGSMKGVPHDDWVDVSGFLNLGDGQVWVPPAMEEVFKTGAATYKDMHKMTRALLKTGARWRALSTAYSPTTTVGSTLSNTFAFSGSGDLYRVEAGKALRHSARQAWSALKRGGQAADDRAFELSLTGHGLGAGTVSGELGQVSTELGMTPQVGRSGSIPKWAEKVGVDPEAQWARKATHMGRRAGQFARDAFQQGDVIFKRAMASLIAADFEQIRLNGTENDIKNIMVGMFGSDDPVLVASDMTSNMTQSYQRVSQGSKDLGKSGVVGLFTSFPYESTRNFGWGAAYTLKYIKGAAMAESPIVRKILMERAMRSIAGMSINMRFLSELGEIAEETLGPELTDKQRETFKNKMVPEWDRGPMAIVGRDKDKMTYIPGGNLEYFQTPRRILENLGSLAGHVMNGQWNQIDEDLIKTTTRLSDDFLQFHQPARGAAEAIFNQKIEGSPLSVAASRFSRRSATRLSTSPIGTEYVGEAWKKGLRPGLTPTPIRQALGLGEWATSPDPEAGISPREVTPFKIKNLDMKKTIGAIGGRLAEEKNNFATQIGKINKEMISPQEKAKRIARLRDDWNSDFGPKIARDVEDLRTLYTRREINEALKQVGNKTIIAAVNGRIPRFEQVFRESIPGRVRFYMRRR